jgi:hypothetical protein
MKQCERCQEWFRPKSKTHRFHNHDCQRTAYKLKRKIGDTLPLKMETK